MDATHIFERDGDQWLPQPCALGPWGESLHGGAPAGLLAHALEEAVDDAALVLQRLTIDLYRPVPFTAVSIVVRPLREGRRLRVLEAVLMADGRDCVRATGLFTALAPAEDVPAAREAVVPAALGIDHAQAETSLMGPAPPPDVRPGLYSFLRVRRVHGEPGSGEAAAWLRMPLELAPGLPLSDVAHLAVLADFANGLGQRRVARRSLGQDADGMIGFINADITLTILRPPKADWVLMDVRNESSIDGRALVSAECYDADGIVARVAQIAMVMGTA